MPVYLVPLIVEVSEVVSSIYPQDEKLSYIHVQLPQEYSERGEIPVVWETLCNN
jgi:hypothetical protein